MTESSTRRLFQLVEPVAVVTYMADEPTEAVMALGLRNVWGAYFAGRAAPLGRDVPAAVVHALFYNFADGEVARHIPRVWDTVTPEAANAAREQGSVVALQRILGDLAETPAVTRAPRAPAAPRGHASRGLRPGLSHLPHAQLAAVVDGMRARGLIGADGWLTAAGRQTKERVETLTDELAAPANDTLEPDELEQLVEALEPLATVLVAARFAVGKRQLPTHDASLAHDR